MWKRIKRLWQLSGPPEQEIYSWNGVMVTKDEFENMVRPKPMAEFIKPNKVKAILESKPDASLQDVIE